MFKTLLEPKFQVWKSQRQVSERPIRIFHLGTGEALGVRIATPPCATRRRFSTTKVPPAQIHPSSSDFIHPYRALMILPPSSGPRASPSGPTTTRHRQRGQEGVSSQFQKLDPNLFVESRRRWGPSPSVSLRELDSQDPCSRPHPNTRAPPLLDTRISDGLPS